MNARIKNNTGILFIFSIISFASILYILYHVNTNLIQALNIYKTDFGTIHYLIGLAHLLVLFFHLYAIIYIFIHFRYFQELKLLKTNLLILAVISLFAIGVEKVMIDEIAREYRHGMGINEIYLLNFAYLINMAFSLLMFLFLLKTFKLMTPADKKDNNIDEKIFVIAQYMGILAGLTGLLFTFHMLHFVRKEILVDKYWVFIPFYVMFLTPYALAVLYWLALKFKQRIEDWYDEKQLQDMFRSSFMTLILSVPGLALLLLFQIPHPIFWIFYYIFLIILLFSSGTLYYFKIKDTVWSMDDL